MSHVGLWSSKNGKKSSRNTSFTLCWLMTLREETDDARLILLLTKYACRVKKKWLLLSITHQKSPEEERLYRSSELAKQFPRMRRRNVSSLTFEKLFVWLKNKGKPPTLRICGMQRQVREHFYDDIFHTAWTVSATTLVKTFVIISAGYRLFNSSVLGQAELKKTVNWKFSLTS